MGYQKCPICEGKKTVPYGFYEDVPPHGNTTAQPPTREQCRTCNGIGTLYVADPTPLPPVPHWPPGWPQGPFIINGLEHMTDHICSFDSRCAVCNDRNKESQQFLNKQ